MGLFYVLSETGLNFVHVNSLCWPSRTTLSSGTTTMMDRQLFTALSGVLVTLMRSPLKV